MRQIIYTLISIVILSCDMGLVKVMDRDEFNEEKGLEPKELKFYISSGGKTFKNDYVNTIYIQFEEDIEKLTSDDWGDVRSELSDKIEITNGSINSLSRSSNGDYLNYISISFESTGNGDVTVKIPEKSICFPYDKNEYAGYYNLDSLELNLKEDQLFQYALDGMDISDVCGINNDQYLIVDTGLDKVYKVGGEYPSVLAECTIPDKILDDMEYNATDNELYMLFAGETDLYVLDVETMSVSTMDFLSSFEGVDVEYDPINRRIYILDYISRLYSLNMDTGVVIINNEVINADHMVIDPVNEFLYTGDGYDDIYKYSISGDVLTELLHNAASDYSYYSELYISSDGSYIYHGNDCVSGSDLSESELDWKSGWKLECSKDLDTIFLCESGDYDNFYQDSIYQYSMVDQSLLKTTNFRIFEIDGGCVNQGGTEALLYYRDYNHGSYPDIIEFIDLQ